VVAEYLGTHDSGFARALESGDRRYHLARLRRTGAADPGPLLPTGLRALAADGAAETARLLDPTPGAHGVDRAP
jgi:hypothetical protein